MATKKVWIAFLTLLLVFLSLLGCTSKTGQQTTPAPSAASTTQPSASTTPAKPAQQVTLKFWKSPQMADAEEQKVMGDLIKKFEQQNPNIKIEHLVLPWDGALTKYTASFSSNDAPDVTYQILPWLSTFVSAKALMPIESIESGADALNGVYDNFSKAAEGPDGKHYGVPYLSSMAVLAVNQKVWERAGKPAAPKTYGDLITFAKALTFDKNGKHPGEAGFDKKNIDVYGWLESWEPAQELNYRYNYLWAYGADYLNKEGTDIGFNNDNGKAAMKVMKDMIDSGAASPAGLYSKEAWNDAIVSGKIAAGFFQRITDEQYKQYPDASMKVLETPAGPSGQFLLGGAGFLSVPAKSQHPKEALQFIKFLTDEANAKSFLRAARLYPVKKMGTDLYQGIGKDEQFMADAAAQAKYMNFTRVGLPFAPDDIIIAEMDNYMGGKKSLDSMLGDLSKQVQLMVKNSATKK